MYCRDSRDIAKKFSISLKGKLDAESETKLLNSADQIQPNSAIASQLPVVPKLKQIQATCFSSVFIHLSQKRCSDINLLFNSGRL
jgi:hypothetical protein